MPVFIFIIILIAGIIMLARSVLFWLYFIQTKQYRLDRIWASIKSREFWKLIFSKHRVLVISLIPLTFIADLAIFIITIYIDRYFERYIYVPQYVNLFYIYVLFYAIWSIKLFLVHQIKLPQLTAKVFIILSVVLILEGGILINFYHDLAVLFLLYATFELMQPLIILGIFALAYTPNIFLYRRTISRARQKIAAHKNLVVIGITGSYGKTSTKEFLAHILSKKFQVLKTPAHINVDTGVAKVILKQLKPEHEIFIVEMGAYCKGEIRRICNLVKPQYAILTGLSDQHLELFGSLKAITEAKFEIIETIRDQNKIVSNAESKPLVIEFERRKLKPIWYGLSARAQIKAHYVGFAEQGALFKINNIQFQTALIGRAALNNLLGAITMAHSLGMSIEEIAKAVGDLHFVPHTMEPRLLANGALIIDDTYNANTEGVLSALEDLQYYNRTKKILVFKEVIELGEKTESDHIQIAKTIARTTACVVLLPSRVRQILYNTLTTEGYDSTRIIDPRDYTRLKDIINGDTVVLFEGRGGEETFKFLISNSPNF